jgi:zinc/manganese transport system substrate-binding protein
LLQKAGNTHTQPGSAGYLMVADIVPVLEKPISIDRANGDVHPEGNPHVQLNPHNIAIAAKAVAERMEALDPENASTYRAHYADFAARWNAAMLRWEQQVANLKGLSVVVHHKSFIYLLDWLGMKEVASLEPKPGLPPTSSHLEGLLQKLKTTPAQLIIRTPYDPDDASQWLSEKTGVPAVVLPYTVGGDVQSGDLFGLFDSTLAALEGATHAER